MWSRKSNFYLCIILIGSELINFSLKFETDNFLAQVWVFTYIFKLNNINKYKPLPLTSLLSLKPFIQFWLLLVDTNSKSKSMPIWDLKILLNMALGHCKDCQIGFTTEYLLPLSLNTLEHFSTDGIAVWVEADLNHVVRGQVTPVVIFTCHVEQLQGWGRVPCVPANKEDKISINQYSFLNVTCEWVSWV